MKTNAILVVLSAIATLTTLMGCTEPTGSEVGSAEQNYDGPPATIAEDAVKEREAAEAAWKAKTSEELKAALLAAYRAGNNPSNLVPDSITRLTAHSYASDVKLVFWRLPNNDRLTNALNASDFSTSAVFIAQIKTGSTSTLEFLPVGKHREGLIMMNLVSPTPALRCTGVTAKNSPTAAQCGVKG